MKYLLTIILFMSVNVFADFNITTLECELGESNQKRLLDSFYPKLSLRIDEKRKTMRLNLMPEVSYSTDLGYAYASSFYFSTNHTIELSIDSLVLYYKIRPSNTKDSVFSTAFYSCKII